jgi:DNA mismatch repair ATPase MutL
MAEKTLQIEVQEDHLERISQTKKPILAIAELVWNALDADASRVTISLPESALGGLTPSR